MRSHLFRDFESEKILAEVHLYKQNDSPWNAITGFIFVKKEWLPLYFQTWNHNLNISQLHNSPEKILH